MDSKTLIQTATPGQWAEYVYQTASLWAHLARIIEIAPRQVTSLVANLREAADDPNPGEYEALKLLAVGYLETGEPMPRWLAEFASRALLGTAPPRRRGRPGNVDRDFRLARAAQSLKEHFGLGLYSNDSATKHKKTAAEIVAEVTGVPHDAVVRAIKAWG